MGSAEPAETSVFSAPQGNHFLKIEGGKELNSDVFYTIFQGTCFCVKVRLLSIKIVTKIYHLPPKAFFEKKNENIIAKRSPAKKQPLPDSFG